MKKVIFLGASVTAQTVHHKTGQITGYVESFRKKYASRLDFEHVGVSAWGGNRLADAGMVCIHKALAEKPDIVIIEPVVEDRSRGIELNEKHLQTIYQACFKNGVLPIALALPRPNGRDPFGHPNYAILKQYCNLRNLPLITITIPIEIDQKSLFRDSIHTNEIGADFYATQIFEELDVILKSDLNDLKIEPKTSVYEINEVSSDVQGDFKSIQIMNKDYYGPSGSIAIIQKQKIGPYSPIVESEVIWKSGERTQMIDSIWDPYCHYERYSYVKLIEMDRSDFAKININISGLLPEYNKCRENLDFTNYSKHRHMRSTESFWVISDHPSNLEIKMQKI